MTTFERLKNYFSESGLSDGFIQQDYIWNEKEGNDSDSYIVFQQLNGTGRIDDLSGDDFFTADGGLEIPDRIFFFHLFEFAAYRLEIFEKTLYFLFVF